MRQLVSTRSAQTGHSHLDLRRMADAVDGSLGNAAVQRKSVYDLGNYRGIHLTSQISKVAESVVAFLAVPQLIYTAAFGRNQFAYMPKR